MIRMFYAACFLFKERKIVFPVRMTFHATFLKLKQIVFVTHLISGKSTTAKILQKILF